MNRPTLIASLAFLTAAALRAQDPGPGDPAAIRWFVPGTFEQAREQAIRSQRILLVKGISFGVDEVGATCATKGRW